MDIYFSILRFNFLRYLTYPLEIIATVGSNIAELLLLLLFWSVIAASSHGAISLPHIIGYILIATAVSEIIMSEDLPFTKQIKDTILLGQLSNFMLRPMNLLPYLYADFVGQEGLSLIIALIQLLFGVVINPPSSLPPFLLFVLFLVPAIVISLTMNILIGSIGFYTGEVSMIRYSINHLIGFFSGLLVPLYLMPASLTKILLLTPFPYLIYVPTHALQLTYVSLFPWGQVLTSWGWAIILIFVTRLVWDFSIRKYEAIGI